MSQYAWHPLHPPAPSNSDASSRIALISPIGKCLQDALDELCEQDRSLIEDALPNPNESKDASSVECHADKYELKSSVERNAMDLSMTKSILESYAHAVLNTSFDNRSKKQAASTATASSAMSDQSTTSTTAPAALLRGQIQHYNRIGGQWRIIVTNATLIPRNVCADAKGRKRWMLDWGDHCTENEASQYSNVECTKKRRVDGAEEYHFKGSIQVLAYDDDT